MIIIEGVDKTGKTTLAFELKKKLGLDIKKFGVPDGNPIAGYYEELKSVKRPKIYDRFIYGEYPYSKVKRPNKMFMDTLSFTMLELTLMTKPHVVVWANPNTETLQQNFIKLGDEYVTDLVELMHIQEHYEKIMKQSMCHVIHYDYTKKEDFTNVLFNVKNAIHWVEWERYNKIGDGIGALYPHYLFVKDRFSFSSANKEPYWDNDGLFLINAIINAGIPIKQCHFTTAIGRENKKITLKQILLLGPTHVIALGSSPWEHLKNYKDNLIDKNIKLAKVPSPRYWKRIKSNQEDEYEEGLRLSCGIFEPILAKRHSLQSLDD